MDSFCDQCGSLAELGDHVRCALRRRLEPPRFCAHCAAPDGGAGDADGVDRAVQPAR